MPKQGFIAITISKSIHDKIKEGMEEANKSAGYRKYRSVAHYVEACIMAYEPTEISNKK